MAALNFPDPAVTQEFEAAGILWTWNATLGVWSSDLGGSSDEFLSKVNDDTAAGEIAFEKLTTHEDGIETAIIQGSGNSPSSPLQIANYKFNGNKLASLKGNAAMSLLSTKGKYNFRDGTDSDNTGEIQAGKVSAQGGVSVTGGDETTINQGIGVSDLDRLALINDNKSIATFGKDGLTYGMYLNSDLQLTQTGKAPHVVQVDYYGTGHVNTAELAFYAGVCKSDAGCNLDMFSARQGNVYPQSAAGIRVTGFYSNTSPDVVTGAGSKAYNFYAAGTAPSYFQGPIEAEGTVNATFGSAAAPAYSFLTKENAGVYFEDTNRVNIATSGVRRATFASGTFECPGIYNNTDSSSSDVVVDADGRLRRKGSSRAYKTNIEPIEYSYAENILNNAQPVYYKPKVQDPEYPQAYLDMLDAQIAAGNTDISPSVYQCEEFCDENNIPWTMDEKWMNEGSNPDYSYWGFIAEDLAEVDPRLTTFNPHLDRYDGVRYAEFTPVLLKICQRQRDQIADLEVRLAALEGA